MLRRPTTLEQKTVPLTGRMLVEPDAGAPAASVRRVTIVTSDVIRAQIDGALDDIARTRGIAWPYLPTSGMPLRFFLLPTQFIGAISENAGLAQCSVLIEYFERMPGEV